MSRSFFAFKFYLFENRTAISLCGAEVACVMACLSMLAGMEHNLILSQNIDPDRERDQEVDDSACGLVIM